VSASTHEAAEIAGAAGADFVVFGPVFPSPGKGPPRGLDELRAAVAGAGVPVFALGGVDENNALSVAACGAGVACIRAVLGAADPAAAARGLYSVLTVSV
jgi:thiamine-phosphate pyrophosphorylase